MIAFLRSPIAQYLAIGLAVVLALFAIRHAGYTAGTKHEHAIMQKRADQIQASLDVCRANGNALQATIAGQNRAVEAIQAVSDRKLADAATALSLASKGRAGAEAKAAKLLANPPAGIDACARMTSADEKVLEALR